MLDTLKKRYRFRIITPFIFTGLFVLSALSFADDNQDVTHKATVGELAKEKAPFNRNQAVYNDKANKNIKSKEQDNKRVLDEQDQKNGLLQKDGQDQKNEQYDKRLIVKF